MRVKIAYSVGLEEVESEVQEILSRGLNSLEEVLRLTTEACISLDKGDTNLEKVLEKLQTARLNMFKADSNISDCHDILLGYSQVLEKAKEDTEDEET